MRNLAKRLGYLFFISFLLISCSGTELKQEKVDVVYKGKPVSNILIVAITGNEHNRRLFENKFVEHLNSIGVDAVASEEAIPMPGDLEIKKEKILEAVRQYENDAVIITQLIAKDEKDVYTRGSSRRGIFAFHSQLRVPGQLSKSIDVQLETNLFEVKTEQLMWSGRSKAWKKGSHEEIINEVIKAVIDDLQKNSLIVPKNQ